MNKQYVLSLSYGKDSLACLGAIEKLGWPLDRIVHAEIWATDTISADLPLMLEFKQKADAIIEDRYGIKVEHISANRIDGVTGNKVTYEDGFYHVLSRGAHKGKIKGFPMVKGPWCQKLKLNAVEQVANSIIQSGNGSAVQYLGIAKDEPERLERLDGVSKISPLEAIDWTEAQARIWCEENDLLSPIYQNTTRGGCWFCHNQSVDQLRMLRRNHPELWNLLMKWDLDSPVLFHADGHTVHDFDRRFSLEDKGRIPADRRFRWSMLKRQFTFRRKGG